MFTIKKYGTENAELISELNRLECESAALDSFKTEIPFDSSMKASIDMACIFTAEKNGSIVAILSIFAPTLNEIEVNALVHPEHRNGGIFHALVTAVVRECATFGYHQGLFACNEESLAAPKIMSRWSCPLHRIEYQMHYTIDKADQPVNADFELSEAQLDQLEKLSEIGAMIFNMDKEEEALILRNNIQSQERTQWVFARQGEIIGLCGTALEKNRCYIFGLGIHPAERGNGYARILLDLVAKQAARQDIKTLCLDVDSNNPVAHTLYKSYGFTHVNVMRYYKFTFLQMI